MGYSIRVDRWRYTAWLHWDRALLQPRWDAGLVGEVRIRPNPNPSLTLTCAVMSMWVPNVALR